MLKTKTAKHSPKHGLHTQIEKNDPQKEITDESLNSMMTLLRSQALQYKNAGLTQVSNWL